MLTKREKEVLESAKQGDSVKMTAVKLGIAINTVQTIRQKIYAKLGCNNITGALLACENKKTAYA